MPALTLDVCGTAVRRRGGRGVAAARFQCLQAGQPRADRARGRAAAGRRCVPPSSRAAATASDAAWMLLLDVQRLLNRQADFEETGIQYCITYEVSPPSWEPSRRTSESARRQRAGRRRRRSARLARQRRSATANRSLAL